MKRKERDTIEEREKMEEKKRWIREGEKKRREAEMRRKEKNYVGARQRKEKLREVKR